LKFQFIKYQSIICFLIQFSTEFAKMTPEEFVAEVLVKQLQVKGVCLGFNARFGKDRLGSARMMRELAAKYEFDFEEAEDF